jgi:glyoxylase-like metal-dependent hydrolase (beta-lactamase superfamily II)
MKIQTIPVGALQENTYLVVDEGTRRAVFVDPGDEPERLLRALDAAGATLDAIWLTHSHMDHVGGIAGIVRRHDVPVLVHPAGKPVYDGAAEHARYFGLEIEQPPPATGTLNEGDTVSVGDTQFQVMHTPGHEPGHVVIHGNGVAFVGDCLFAGSVGRTDLPLASGPELARSLQRIAELGDDVKVYPGHGPATTIGHERRYNPFLNGSARIAGSP